jgi:hypothetical protein
VPWKGGTKTAEIAKESMQLLTKCSGARYSSIEMRFLLFHGLYCFLAAMSRVIAPANFSPSALTSQPAKE